MKILQSLVFGAALGLTSLVGTAAPEAPAKQIEYVATMKGVT